MSKILIVSGHPNLPESTANKTALEAVKARFGDAVTVRELDKTRVNGKFDIAAEQKALVEHDVLVLQFPVFWYSVPSLLKQWIDDVFEYGFAYGTDGTALQGKKFLLSATAGAAEDIYQNMLPSELPRPLPTTRTLRRSQVCSCLSRCLATAPRATRVTLRLFMLLVLSTVRS